MKLRNVFVVDKKVSSYFCEKYSSYLASTDPVVEV